MARQSRGEEGLPPAKVHPVADSFAEFLGLLGYVGGKPPPQWVLAILDNDLTYLRQRSDAEGKQWLLKAFDEHHRFPFEFALLEDRWEPLQLFLERGESATQVFERALILERYQIARRLLPLGVKQKAIQKALTQFNSHAFWHEPDVIAAFLEAGADVNHADRSYGTPLHLAVRAGSLEAVKLLLSRGALPHKKFEGSTPLDLALEAGHTEIADLLREAIQKSSTSKSKGKPKKKIPDVAPKPLDLHGVKIRRSAGPLTEEQLAAVEEKLEFTFPSDYRQFLLRFNGGIPRPNDFRLPREELGLDEEDEEMIEEATRSAVTRFLPVGERLGAGGLDDWTLEDALENLRETECPSWLVPIAEAEGGLCVCISVKGKDRGHVYYRPDVEAHEDTVYELADSFEGFLALLSQQQTPTTDWVAAIQDGNVEAVRQWLDAGGKVDSTNQDGKTPGALAAEEGRPAVLDLLLDRGASSAEAMDVAVRLGRGPVIQHLVKRGLSEKVLRGAFVAGLSKGDEHGRLLSSENGIWHDLATVKQLLAAGADPSYQEAGSGLTALHWAAAVRPVAPQAVRLLLEAGADASKVDVGGSTPLHRAAAPGEDTAESVRLLLQHGAKVDIWNNEGHTPLHEACGSACMETLKLLLDAGAELHARAGRPHPAIAAMSPKTLARAAKAMQGSLKALKELDKEMGDVMSQLSGDDPMSKMLLEAMEQGPVKEARKAARTPAEQAQAQMEKRWQGGESAAEVLEKHLHPKGKKMVPGSEILAELEAYLAEKPSSNR